MTLSVRLRPALGERQTSHWHKPVTPRVGHGARHNAITRKILFAVDMCTPARKMTAIPQLTPVALVKVHLASQEPLGLPAHKQIARARTQRECALHRSTNSSRISFSPRGALSQQRTPCPPAPNPPGLILPAHCLPHLSLPDTLTPEPLSA